MAILKMLSFKSKQNADIEISFEKVLSLNQLLGPRNMPLAELELLRARGGHVV